MFQSKVQKGLFTFYWQQEHHHFASDDSLKGKPKDQSHLDQKREGSEANGMRKQTKRAIDYRIPQKLSKRLRELSRANKEIPVRNQVSSNCLKPTTFVFEADESQLTSQQEQLKKQRAQTLSIHQAMSESIIEKHLHKVVSEKKCVKPYVYSLKELEERLLEDGSILKGSLRKRGKLEWEYSPENQLHRHKTLPDSQKTPSKQLLVRLPSLSQQRKQTDRNREKRARKAAEYIISSSIRFRQTPQIKLQAPSLLPSASSDSRNTSLTRWKARRDLLVHLSQKEESTSRTNSGKQKKTGRRQQGVIKRRIDILERLQKSGLIDKLKKEHEDQINKGLRNRKPHISVLFSTPSQFNTPVKSNPKI